MAIKSRVFVALTRPAMIFGVTLDYLSLSFMVSIASFILGGSFRYLLMYFPLHAIGWLACKFDYHIFSLINKKWSCAVCPNKFLWGCQSYDPM